MTSEEELQQLRAQLDKANLRLRKLRLLMGFVENGTSQCVTLCQDDATMEFTISVNRKHFDGRTFTEALDNIEVKEIE